MSGSSACDQHTSSLAAAQLGVDNVPGVMPPPKTRPRLNIKVGGQLVHPSKAAGQSSKQPAGSLPQPPPDNNTAQHPTQPAAVHAQRPSQTPSDTSDLQTVKPQQGEPLHQLPTDASDRSPQAPVHSNQPPVGANQQQQLQPAGSLGPKTSALGAHVGPEASALGAHVGSAAAGTVNGYYRLQRGVVRGLLLALELPQKGQVALYRPATGAAAKPLAVSQLAARSVQPAYVVHPHPALRLA